MEQYIPKSALIAEIERRIKTNKECMLGLRNLDYYQGKVDALKDTLSFLDTLEVREVDWVKEAERFVQTKEFIYSAESPVILIAKHFFELGLNTSNSLTWKDIDLILDIIDQIANDDSMEEKLNSMSQEKYCTEVLKRFKAQKGE